MNLSPTQWKRFQEAEIIWLATVTPSNRSHLIPIWFVTTDEIIWICTGKSSKKTRNIQTNPHVSISLEDGKKPIMGEGVATLVSDFESMVRKEFKQKYDWTLDTSSQYNILIRVEISKWVLKSQ